MVFFQSDEEELETDNDEGELADDLLDEVADDDSGSDDEIEGFGLVDNKEEEEDKENEEEDFEGDDELEDDAEDVDFDTFDDIDEM